MAQMLASDVNNPAYVGAMDPDSLLNVEFYYDEPVDKWRSDTEGKIIKKPRSVYVRIQRGGDLTSQVVALARDDHKLRFPRQWAAFEIAEGLAPGVADALGWRLEDWPHLNEQQVHELKYLHFQTVEQIAGASDGQTQHMGMGGAAVRLAAQQALLERSGKASTEVLAAKDREIAGLQERLERIEAMMGKRTEDEPPRRGPGRPSKADMEARE